MRKLFFVILILVAAAFWAGAQEKVNIVFYTPAWGNDYIKAIIAKYAPDHPNVNIQLFPGPSQWADHVAKTQLWMNTKYSGVDLEYQDDVFARDGAMAGVWEDLWPSMSQSQKDDLTDVQLQFKQTWGGYYRIPWWQGMSYMYYNKKIFKDAGMTVPTTWADLMKTATKLTRDVHGTGKVDQFGYLATGEEGAFAHSFWEFLYQAGADEWTLSPNGKADPKAKQALTFMKELFQKAAPKDQPAIGYDQGRAYMKGGKAAMFRDWSDLGVQVAQEHLQDTVGVMNFPAGPAGPYGIAHGWGVVVNKYGENFQKNKDAVMDFALFMLKPDVHELTAVQELPALKSVYSDAAFMAKLKTANINAAVAPQWWKWRKTRKLIPGHGAEYMNGEGKMAIAGVFGNVSVDKTLQDMQDLIDSLK